MKQGVQQTVKQWVKRKKVEEQHQQRKTIPMSFGFEFETTRGGFALMSKEYMKCINFSQKTYTKVCKAQGITIPVPLNTPMSPDNVEVVVTGDEFVANPPSGRSTKDERQLYRDHVENTIAFGQNFSLDPQTGRIVTFLDIQVSFCRGKQVKKQRRRWMFPADFIEYTKLLCNIEFIVTLPNPIVVNIEDMTRIIYSKFIMAFYYLVKFYSERFTKCFPVLTEAFPFRCFDYDPISGAMVFWKSEEDRCFYDMAFTPQITFGVELNDLKTVCDHLVVDQQEMGILDWSYIVADVITQKLFEPFELPPQPERTDLKNLKDYFFFFLYSYLNRDQRKYRQCFILRFLFYQVKEVWIGQSGIHTLNKIITDGRDVLGRCMTSFLSSSPTDKSDKSGNRQYYFQDKLVVDTFLNYFHSIHSPDYEAHQSPQRTPVSQLFPSLVQRQKMHQTTFFNVQSGKKWVLVEYRFFNAVFRATIKTNGMLRQTIQDCHKIVKGYDERHPRTDCISTDDPILQHKQAVA